MNYLQVASIIDHYENLLMSDGGFQAKVFRKQQLKYYKSLQKQMSYDFLANNTFNLSGMP